MPKGLGIDAANTSGPGLSRDDGRPAEAIESCSIDHPEFSDPLLQWIAPRLPLADLKSLSLTSRRLLSTCTGPGTEALWLNAVTPTLAPGVQALGEAARARSAQCKARTRLLIHQAATPLFREVSVEPAPSCVGPYRADGALFFSPFFRGERITNGGRVYEAQSLTPVRYAPELARAKAYTFAWSSCLAYGSFVADDQLYVIDDTSVQKVDLPHSVHFAEWRPDGRHLVAWSEHRDMTLVGLQMGQFRQLGTFGRTAAHWWYGTEMVALLPDDPSWYALSSGERSPNARLLCTPPQGHSWGYLASQRWLVSENNRSRFVYDLETGGTKLSPYRKKPFAAPWDRYFARLGAYQYFFRGSAGEGQLLDTVSLSVLRRIPGKIDHLPELNHAATHIAFGRAGRVEIMACHGDRSAQVFETGKPLDMCWSYDDVLLAVLHKTVSWWQRQEKMRVSFIDTKTGVLLSDSQVVLPPGLFTCIAWAPHGAELRVANGIIDPNQSRIGRLSWLAE